MGFFSIEEEAEAETAAARRVDPIVNFVRLLIVGRLRVAGSGKGRKRKKERSRERGPSVVVEELRTLGRRRVGRKCLEVGGISRDEECAADS